MKNLKKTRMAKGIPQQTVADYLGINRVSYARYESGERQPDFHTAERIADLFGVSVDYLLGRDNSPRPRTEKKGVKINWLPQEMPVDVRFEAALELVRQRLQQET